MRVCRVAVSCFLTLLLNSPNVTSFARAQAVSIVTNCSTYDGSGGLGAALAAGGKVTFACSGTVPVPQIIVGVDTSIDATGQSVTLSGNHANRIFCVNSGVTFTLKSLLVRDGAATNGDCAQSGDTGGGIYNAGTLAMTDSTISGNSASNGGGIYSLGRVTLTNSVISHNSAINGGGSVTLNSTLTISNSTISGNTAKTGGGGVLILNSTLTITHSTISGNSAAVGGGILNQNGTATIANSTISGNAATTSGGGGVLSAGQMTVFNCTLTGNSAANGGGGGILSQAGPLTITNSTISGNSALAYGAGGGIFSGGGPAAARMKNTIVAGNKGDFGPDIYGEVISQGHNLIGSTADATGFVDSDLRNVNPDLGPLTGNPAYYPLTPDSPAINAGDNVGCPVTDEPGTARPQDSACDIGAFEYVTNLPTGVPANASTATPPQ